MLFPVVFVLFFTLDILLITRFSSFGLVPVFYLSAGTGLFMAWFLYRYRNQGTRTVRDAGIFRLYFFSVILIFLNNFLQASMSLIVFLFKYDVKLLFVLSGLTEIPILIFSFIILIMVILKPSRSPLEVWILLSVSVTVLKYGLFRFYDALPPLLWRYGGVLDMAILFCWLVIIHKLLEEEMESEQSDASALSLR